MSRLLSTKEKLSDSLRALAESTPVAQLTVSAIAKGCGVSTTTFYNHFQDKYELIAWTYATAQEDAMEDAEGSYLECFIRGAANALSSDIVFYRNAFGWHLGEDLLGDAVSNYSLDALGMYLTSNSSGKPNQSDLFLLEMYTHGITAMLRSWLINGAKEPVDTLARWLVEGCPQQLKSRLL